MCMYTYMPGYIQWEPNEPKNNNEKEKLLNSTYLYESFCEFWDFRILQKLFRNPGKGMGRVFHRYALVYDLLICTSPWTVDHSGDNFAKNKHGSYTRVLPRVPPAFKQKAKSSMKLGFFGI